MYVVTSFRCWQPGLTHRGNYSNTWTSTFVQWSKPRSNQTWERGEGGMIPQPPRALSGTGTRRLWSWSWGFSSVSWPLHVLLSAIGNELLLSPLHDKWEKDNPWWLRCAVYFFLHTLSSVLMLRFNLETALTLHQNYYTEYPNHLMNIFSWHYLICMSIIP